MTGLEVPSHDDLNELISRRPGPCVSIYLPTVRAGKDTRENPIRYKNLLREAEDRLRAAGMRDNQILAVTKPGNEILASEDFWEHPASGLAVFLAKDFSRHWRLPVPVEQIVVVNERFSVKPLLPFFAGDGKFFILALSEDETRLLRATRHEVERIDAPTLPRNIDEALPTDEYDEPLQWHTNTPRPAVPSGDVGGRRAMFHGHGAGYDDTKKRRILRYFRKVDAAVTNVLRDDSIPLVLAGVEEHFPVYREANTYANLLDHGIKGNPEGVSDVDLRARAWEIVAPLYDHARAKATDVYRRLAGSARERRASNDLEEVVLAAHEGRVDTLFVPAGKYLWGAFDEDARRVELGDASSPRSADLLDIAAVMTLMKGGIVYAVPPEEVPDASPVAAILRY